MRLVNATEVTVMELVNKVMKAKNMCDCERCRLDVAAIALNNLPPSYVVTTEGEVVKAGNQQLKIDALRQIEEAIKKVTDQPHHRRS